MGRLLVLSLQAVAVDLLTIIVIDIPTRGFDAGVRGLVDIDFDLTIDVDGDIAFGGFWVGPWSAPAVVGDWWVVKVVSGHPVWSP